MIDKNLRYLVVINIPEGLRIKCSKLINAEDPNSGWHSKE